MPSVNANNIKIEYETFGSKSDKPLLMDPPLPYVYGQNEQDDTPQWLIQAVEAVRAKQPTEWAPGETPWPKAPQGAVASKMDGLKDEATTEGKK